MSQISMQKVLQLSTNIGKFPFKQGGAMQRQDIAASIPDVVRVGAFPCWETKGFRVKDNQGLL